MRPMTSRMAHAVIRICRDAIWPSRWTTSVKPPGFISSVPAPAEDDFEQPGEIVVRVKADRDVALVLALEHDGDVGAELLAQRFFDAARFGGQGTARGL